MTNPVSGGVPEQPCSICGGERTRCEAGVLCVDGCDDAFLDAIEAYYDTCRPDGAPADAESKLRIAIAAFWKSRAALERPRPDVCPECGGLAAHWGNCSRWRPALPAPEPSDLREKAQMAGIRAYWDYLDALPSKEEQQRPSQQANALIVCVNAALKAGAAEVFRLAQLVEPGAALPAPEPPREFHRRLLALLDHLEDVRAGRVRYLDRQTVLHLAARAAEVRP